MVTSLIASVVIACMVATYCTAKDFETLIDAPPASHIDVPLMPPYHDNDGLPARNKRATNACSYTPATMTDGQKTEAINAHNGYRKLEPAANLLMMGWDDYLAALAQAWAQQCLWQHGMTSDCNGNAIGQNLYMVYGGSEPPTLNLTKAITSWNNERQNWNFSSGVCQPGQVCGHWTQVVWDESSLVGCGYAYCPTVTSSTSTATYNNALIVACDYNPPGNWVGEAMYISGPSCSACSSITRSQATNRGYKCIDGLCVPCSPASDQTCQCGTPDVCLNGGTWSDVDCSCKCATGFFGSTCQTACADVALSSSCAYWTGLGYCDTTSVYYAYMKANCVKTCSLCPN